jgi:hypothetical protein
MMNLQSLPVPRADLSHVTAMLKNCGAKIATVLRIVAKYFPYAMIAFVLGIVE